MIVAATSSPLVFYHPTRCAVLGHEEVLREFLDGNDPMVGRCEFFVDPSVLASHVSDENARYAHLVESLIQRVDSSDEDCGFAFSYGPLESLIEHRSRGDACGLVFLDFDFLSSAGLRAIGSVREGAQERILLVGESQIPNAMDAVNNGYVDRFIRKEPPGLITKASWSSVDISWGFHSRSQGVFQPLNLCVESPVIRHAIDRHMRRLVAVGTVREFYRDRASMSYLCINQSGDFLRTAFLDEAQFDECALLARALGAPSDVVKDIR